MKVWTLLTAMISTSVLADQPALVPGTTGTDTNASLSAPAATGSPTATVAPSAAANLAFRGPLVPGPAVVVANRVNVRGRAGLIGEVIGRLENGDKVTVIEEVTLKNSKANEPSAWAKIQLPQSITVWVHSSFVDRASMTVKASRLNLRGGPGENFSVLGRLERGASVREIGSRGDWIQIEPPAEAYGFVAAPYLAQEAPAIVESETPAPVESGVTNEPAEVATVTESPDVAMGSEIPANTNVTEVASAEMPETGDEAPEEEEPLPPRIVQREGIVRSTLGIQAPTKFELVSPENFRPVNYLYSTSPQLDLSRYKGLHIIVSGEEGLDERWKNTPVLTIQEIRVIE